MIFERTAMYSLHTTHILSTSGFLYMVRAFVTLLTTSAGPPSRICDFGPAAALRKRIGVEGFTT